MAEIVNLRRARKAKARAEDDALANANRAKFGATKWERSQLTQETARRDELLDGVRRDDR